MSVGKKKTNIDSSDQQMTVTGEVRYSYKIYSVHMSKLDIFYHVFGTLMFTIPIYFLF